MLLISGVSLLLLNGISRQTAVGLSATLAGVAATALIFLLFSRLLHLSGYNTDDAEALLMAGDSTGMSIRYLLLAGVMISALGAVMDVAVSLAAALEELVRANPKMKRGALMHSGLNIGRDMIATMSNTLILAFAGTGLNTMLCLLAYGYQPAQLLSSDYLAVELAQGLCATLGVVLTVPVTILIAAGLLHHYHLRH
ncbi:MAG: YibE/F family protein [Oscillospiraceae bacterium]|nr:YibE/F family protein [Oscillospiraceae bacterium]